MTAAVDSLIARLADAERRLAEHAARPLPPGLSEPDPGGEERWEAGQVWAHLAEFPAYWLAQAQRVIALPTNEPVPFGRVKTDAGRIAAIERDRNTDPAALLRASATRWRRSPMPPERSRRRRGVRRGIHPTRGEMTVEQIFDTFIARAPRGARRAARLARGCWLKRIVRKQSVIHSQSRISRTGARCATPAQSPYEVLRPCADSSLAVWGPEWSSRPSP